jgi:hypothetical protein
MIPLVWRNFVWNWISLHDQIINVVFHFFWSCANNARWVLTLTNNKVCIPLYISFVCHPKLTKLFRTVHHFTFLKHLFSFMMFNHIQHTWIIASYKICFLLLEFWGIFIILNYLDWRRFDIWRFKSHRYVLLNIWIHQIKRLMFMIPEFLFILISTIFSTTTSGTNRDGWEE